MITTVGKPQVFDIGGIYKLELVKTGSGYCGEYTILKSGATYSFDGTGMTRRKILQKFWDRAKKVDPSISNKGGR
ncbi:hypothetical protein KIOSHI_258 [Bacillus phage Kioshi]|nr:hypothetical protein KIOSHI_2 [Bacillus phage Kioshi]AXQ67874.1 hypothetical protein KIOSHI_258 [Bacillus phage Kioshi]